MPTYVFMHYGWSPALKVSMIGLTAISTMPEISRLAYSLLGRIALGQHLGPWVLGLAWEEVAAAWALLITQAGQFKAYLFLMYSYGQGKFLKAKTTPIPDVLDDDDNLQAKPFFSFFTVCPVIN